MRHIGDEQRRARLAHRHALAARAGSVEEAVASVVCLHATEPPTVYLSAHARAEVSLADIDAALYDGRTVVKQLAMRRTVFAFPRDLLPAAWGSASARVAQQLRARLAKEVESNGLAADGAAWVAQMHEAVLTSLDADGPASTGELRRRLPELERRLEMSPGKSYGGSFPVAPRLLSGLAADGSVMRGRNAGDWRLSRPTWVLTEDWLGAPPEPDDVHEGYRRLVEAWLRRFGPGTEDDLVWWLGSTKAAVRRALGDLDAVEVSLEAGTGWVLPDDLDDDPEPEPWAALLPVLDPTVMGWRHRAFYLDPGEVDQVFDRNGNAGTTAWWNGRVVGCWAQDDDAVVRIVPLGELAPEAASALDAEAERLTAWLDGARVSSVYATALMRSVRA